MSGGGSQSSTSAPPAYIQAEGQNNYNVASQIAQRPYVANPYVQQAPFSEDQLAAFQGVRNQQGQSAANLAPAFQTAQNVSSYNPNQVTAGQFNGADVTSRMNPYTNDVLNPSLKILDQQRQQADNQIASNARSSGAFGGSRQAVQQGVNDAQSSLAAGQLAGNLNTQSYNTALASQQADQNRALTAGQSNQNAGLQGANLNLQGAAQTGNLSALNNNLTSAELNNLSTSGNQQQQLLQNQLGYNSQQFQNAWNYPYQQLNTLTSATSSQPYGSTTTTSGGGNPTASALGGAASGAAIGSTFGPWGTAIGAVGGGLMGAFSDKDEKTDIKKIGNITPDIPAYAYRYKGDPKSYPKVVGPMAQDIEKSIPGSTKKINGKMVVHPDIMAVLMNPLNKFAKG
jgi:hypothetical protein